MVLLYSLICSLYYLVAVLTCIDNIMSAQDFLHSIAPPYFYGLFIVKVNACIATSAVMPRSALFLITVHKFKLKFGNLFTASYNSFVFLARLLAPRQHLCFTFSVIWTLYINQPFLHRKSTNHKGKCLSFCRLSLVRIYILLAKSYVVAC